MLAARVVGSVTGQRDTTVRREKMEVWILQNSGPVIFFCRIFCIAGYVERIKTTADFKRGDAENVVAQHWRLEVKLKTQAAPLKAKQGLRLRSRDCFDLTVVEKSIWTLLCREELQLQLTLATLATATSSSYLKLAEETETFGSFLLCEVQ